MARPSQPGLDPDEFRAVLRRQASTVAVVTAPGSEPGAAEAVPTVGFTVTSFTSVSLHPPLVSFCLARGSSSWPTVAVARHLAVHLLAEEQQELARIFATSGIDRFAGHPGWYVGPHRLPILDGVLARLLCRTVQRVTAGDHVVVIAEPFFVEASGAARPLVYHDGRYTGAEWPSEERAPAGVSAVPRRPDGR